MFDLGVSWSDKLRPNFNKFSVWSGKWTNNKLSCKWLTNIKCFHFVRSCVIWLICKHIDYLGSAAVCVLWELFLFLIRSTVSVSPRMWHLITFLTYFESWRDKTSNHLNMNVESNSLYRPSQICICYFQCNFPPCLETVCRV